MDASPTLSGPVVLGSVNDEGFTSLRRAAAPRAQRYEAGRALRDRSPRSEMAHWRPPADRPDPVTTVTESHAGRVPRLIPVRIGRMIASPYAFLRGTAGLMADDFAGLPHTGITPVICGDAHLGNFGFYASPERELVFDLNDFDEAHTGPWEWDLRRLVVSVYVAGRVNGFRESACGDAVRHCAEEYREQLSFLADQPLLARSFDQLNVEAMRSAASRASFRDEIERAARRARRRTSDRALPRFTERRDGTARLVEEPPLITRIDDQEREQLAEALDGYLNTLKPHWARILGGYRIVDIAHKVVGVGSVGLRAYVALCEGSSPDDVVFLQLKQARRSVVAKHQHGALAWHRHQGQRVVEYQQALQTVSDPLLGWTTVGDQQFYVRQFRDMKGAILVDDLNAGALADYAGICGYLLAKSHARTSGASIIAGYVGGSDKLDDSLCRFARAYADQVERDHAALVAAVRRGDLPADQ
ncbi:hypothetical protein AMIS_52250 [Actinoplanes missouriensis 431]|uniref:DUF2252 domain-containing protein n=1 Tax=Actinoplanes missouriensis (strain ATCC 14538 / DSM 43046 / CBS 188.64 / JCM 3121 / NBRC 102363 / NCIMB 12654 / NRRL B-3342 / UNCC 431) TaxID=512565 RepID=I0HBQ8_ACTM4|nr:DUF2252 domain-containing protein [Actinoplanes missouriensis]BAL90445.1 hypothetical protein AMIS_52250 [Actinoplanes missouriensis 431]